MSDVSKATESQRGAGEAESGSHDHPSAEGRQLSEAVQQLDAHQRLIQEHGRQIDELQRQVDALVDVVEALRRSPEIRTTPVGSPVPEAPPAARAESSSALFPGAEKNAAPPVAKKNAASSNSATIYCDGGCWSNPGPGGWACIVEREGEQEEFAGAKQQTTNNQMELQALIEGLRAVPAGTTVQIVTDSEYLTKGITSWLKGWARNGWMTASKQPVKNREQWQEVLLLLADRPHRAEWVKGHAGHPENERCDRLAQAAIKRLVGARK